MSDYWAQYEGKQVPLKALLQWLSDEHMHVTDDEGEPLEGWNFPVVHSMALQRWAVDEADEVEYEYAAMRIRTSDRARMADPDLHFDRGWSEDLEDVEELVKVLNEAVIDVGTYYEYVLAKRVKAGEIQY